ncbi:hypothetical protein ACSRUE_34155 [Sorangium sp. KYC3313]|uniref:hypothetical protein n=1 Tax=Sorangium sp. KYC3313 TaxID=3449740 RepID=UPI003F89E0FD
MPSAHQKGSLQLRLHAASTPERVLLAATLFDDVVKRAYPSLDPDTITMVVSNFDMTAGMRYYGHEARKAIDGIIRFLTNPELEIAKRPGAWVIAETFAEHSPALAQYGAEVWTPKRKEPIAVIHNEFIATMIRLAQDKKPAPALRGNTVVYSVIYRVGRTSASSRHVRARIELDGKPQEVTIRKGEESAFYDAAKTKNVYAIQLDASWTADESGRLMFDPSRSQANKIEAWCPISGADLIQEVRALHGPLFEHGSLGDIIDELEGR